MVLYLHDLIQGPQPVLRYISELLHNKKTTWNDKCNT